MKIKYLLLIFLLSISIVVAFPSKDISFSVRVIDGSTIIDGSHNFTVKIYDLSTGGSALFSQSFTDLSNVSSRYYFVLNNVNLDFSSQLFVGVTVDGNAEISPRLSFTLAPVSGYSFMSNYSQFINTSNVPGFVDWTHNISSLSSSISYVNSSLNSVNSQSNIQNLGFSTTAQANLLYYPLSNPSNFIASESDPLAFSWFNTLNSSLTSQINNKFSTSGGIISGDVAINGNLYVVGSKVTMNVSELNVNGSSYPSINNTFTLGNVTNRFSRVYGFVDWSDLTNVPTILNGTDGLNGADGYTPIKGVDYFDGTNGVNGTQGIQGIQGIAGINGTNGINGQNGSNGTQGIQGIQGIAGINGLNGTNGINGINGTNGVNGTQGIQGIQGIAGINGLNGTNGINGINGTNGVNGTQGIQGIQGIAGINGLNGTNGINGINGTNGVNGTQGIQGIQGIAGINGLNGTNGINGINGTNGVNGTQGIQGIQGIAGINGLNGTNGINGINGTNGVNGTQGIQGIQGIAGINGLNGTNGINGINGTNGVNGTQGIQGIQGIAGINGLNGTNGINGINGTNGVNGTQGIQGIQGIAGINGLNGTNGLNGINGNSTNVSVINNNDGTFLWKFYYTNGVNYYNFTTQNLTGSKGDQGTQGNVGATGVCDMSTIVSAVGNWTADKPNYYTTLNGNSVANNVTTLQAQNTTNTNTISNLKSDNTTLQNFKSAMSTSNTTLFNGETYINATVNTLITSNQTAINTINNLKTDNTTLQNWKTAMSVSNTSLGTEIDNLNTTLSTEIDNVNSTKAKNGTCSGNQVMQNATSTGVQCVTVTASGDGTGGWTNTSTDTTFNRNVASGYSTAYVINTASDGRAEFGLGTDMSNYAGFVAISGSTASGGANQMDVGCGTANCNLVFWADNSQKAEVRADGTFYTWEHNIIVANVSAHDVTISGCTIYSTSNTTIC